MERKSLDFTIQEAGCLLYAADLNLGGNPFGALDARDWKKLTEKGALLATSLYQDDGYNVRVLFGELRDTEAREWTGRAAWKLNLESGKMVVSGVCDPDIGEYVRTFPVAAQNGDYHLGCIVEIPAGVYAVTIYSFPPNDLSGGWMAIEDASSFKACFGQEPGIKHEKPLAYFARTRPGEAPPDWIIDGWEDADFLDFLIQIVPLKEEELPPLPKFEDDGCLLWEYRKPEICPAGIRLENRD